MRDFTWHVFTQTGDIEAYMFYKEMNTLTLSDSGIPVKEEDNALDEDG